MTLQEVFEIESDVLETYGDKWFDDKSALQEYVAWLEFCINMLDGKKVT